MNRKRVRLKFSNGALVVMITLTLLAVLISSRLVWANETDGGSDNDFNIGIEAATGPDPAMKPAGSGSMDDPIKIKLADPFSSERQQWNVTVTSSSNQVGMIDIKFVDTDPNMKVKNRGMPTSITGDGSFPNAMFYPDLFTQMRFSIYDGTTQLWTGKLGTDGPLDPYDPNGNNPAAPGYLEAKLPVSLKKGESKTLVIKEYIDTTIPKDEMNAYNGTTTGLTLIVKGETR